MDVKASSLNLTNKTVIPAGNDVNLNNDKTVLEKEKKQDAYSVSFSQEGLEKSKVSSNNGIDKDSEAYKEYVSRMDGILGRLADGQSISNKDQQWLDSEVDNLLSGRYDGFGGFEFERADVLSNYIEEKKEKEREYDRLAEQLAADQALHDGRLFSHLKKEHDLQDKEDLVKTLTESLEEEKEDFSTEKDRQESGSDEAYYEAGFVGRYLEKEVQKVEDSVGRDLKKTIKYSSFFRKILCLLIISCLGIMIYSTEAEAKKKMAKKTVEDTTNFYAVEFDENSEIFSRIKGKSYKDDCTVPLSDLRYLHVVHVGFDGETHEGEIICNKYIAEDLLVIFEELYEAKYPIEKIKLVDEYDADDEKSMADNNSSSFNFRFISYTKKISKHGYGLAMDINTLYNPYVKTVNGQLSIEPANAAAYVDRSKDFPYKIDKNDLAYKLFKEHGFEWGGAWKNSKDYQHFEVPDSVVKKLYK